MPKVVVVDKLEATVAALRKNNFDARLARTGEEAKEIVLELVPGGAQIGFGDSTTLRQIGVIDALEARGATLVNPFTRELVTDPAQSAFRRKLLRTALTCDVFMSGTNVVTEDGKLVNVDRVGNRLAGLIFGAPRVVVVAGTNKIVRDVDEGLRRIKDVIAPAHSIRKGKKTPCIKTGKCSDCNSPDRICNMKLILERCPALTEMTVILVDDDLGLGWDPAWPLERVDAIRSRYVGFTWLPYGLQRESE